MSASLRIAMIARGFHPHDGRLLKERRALSESGHEVFALAPEGEAQAPGVTPAKWRGRANAYAGSLVVAVAAALALLAAVALVDSMLAAAAAALLAAGLLLLAGAALRRGLPLRGLPLHLKKMLRFRAQTEACVANLVALAPHVIIALDPESLPAAVRAKRRLGAALVYNARELHEEEDPSDPARAGWVRRVETAAVPHLDGFLTVNQAIARLYRERRPGFPEAAVVHNAAGAGPPPPYDGRLHEAAGLPRDRRIILFQGGLAPMRGLEALAAAGARLPEPWSVVFMGWGRLEPTLRALADPARVRFLPPTAYEELPLWTAGASLGAILYEDVGLNQRYCTPNKIWEFAAAGVPVLASDLPQMRAVLGPAAVYVPPGASAEALAAAVAALDAPKLSSAREAGLALAAKDNWSLHAAAYVAAVERAARR